MGLRPLSIIIGSVVAISYPLWHDGPATQSGTIENKVSGVAEAMNAVMPKSIGDGEGTMTSVTAEGRTLVLHVKDAPNWQESFSESEMIKMSRIMACKNAGFRTLVEEGGAVRMESKDGSGSSLPSILVSSCPR